MIHKRFVLKDVSFFVSFVSLESSKHFEEYTGLTGVNVG